MVDVVLNQGLVDFSQFGSLSFSEVFGRNCGEPVQNSSSTSDVLVAENIKAPDNVVYPNAEQKFIPKDISAFSASFGKKLERAVAENSIQEHFQEAQAAASGEFTFSAIPAKLAVLNKRLDQLRKLETGMADIKHNLQELGQRIEITRAKYLDVSISNDSKPDEIQAALSQARDLRKDYSKIAEKIDEIAKKKEELREFSLNSDYRVSKFLSSTTTFLREAANFLVVLQSEIAPPAKEDTQHYSPLEAYIERLEAFGRTKAAVVTTEQGFKNTVVGTLDGEPVVEVAFSYFNFPVVETVAPIAAKVTSDDSVDFVDSAGDSGAIQSGDAVSGEQRSSEGLVTTDTASSAASAVRLRSKLNRESQMGNMILGGVSSSNDEEVSANGGIVKDPSGLVTSALEIISLAENKVPQGSSGDSDPTPAEAMETTFSGGDGNLTAAADASVEEIGNSSLVSGTPDANSSGTDDLDIASASASERSLASQSVSGDDLGDTPEEGSIDLDLVDLSKENDTSLLGASLSDLDVQATELNGQASSSTQAHLYSGEDSWCDSNLNPLPPIDDSRINEVLSQGDAQHAPMSGTSDQFVARVGERDEKPPRKNGNGLYIEKVGDGVSDFITPTQSDGVTASGLTSTVSIPPQTNSRLDEALRHIKHFLWDVKLTDVIKDFQKVVSQKIKDIAAARAYLKGLDNIRTSSQLDALRKSDSNNFTSNSFAATVPGAIDKIRTNVLGCIENMESQQRDALLEIRREMKASDNQIRHAFKGLTFELTDKNREQIPSLLRHAAVPERFMGRLVEFRDFLQDLIFAVDSLNRQSVASLPRADQHRVEYDFELRRISLIRRDGVTLNISEKQDGCLRLSISQPGSFESERLGVFWNRKKASSGSIVGMSICERFLADDDVKRMIETDHRPRNFVIPDENMTGVYGEI